MNFSSRELKPLLEHVPRHVHVVWCIAPEHCSLAVQGSAAAPCSTPVKNSVRKYLEQNCFTINAFTNLGSSWMERFSAKYSKRLRKRPITNSDFIKISS